MGVENQPRELRYARKGRRKKGGRQKKKNKTFKRRIKHSKE
jgi:hypothetical protein